MTGFEKPVPMVAHQSGQTETAVMQSSRRSHNNFSTDAGHGQEKNGYNSPEPKSLTDVSRLPEQVRSTGLFCVWQYVERDGRRSKVPYNPRTGGKAQPNNPSTFAPLGVAEAAQSNYDGIGVGIFGDLCAIDIDHCIDENGFTELATDIIGTMDSYTEYSPSGKGIRILFTAPGFAYDKGRFYVNNQKRGLEVYVAGATQKYVTVTGHALKPGVGLEERTEALRCVLEKYMKRSEKPTRATPQPRTLFTDSDADGQLIVKACGVQNGALFGALWTGDTSGYQSHSEADLALCDMLAFWTGCDAARMDRLFRQSKLMREKWDRPQSGSTYGQITIQNAIRNCSKVYDPQAHFQKRAAQITTGTGQQKKTLADLHPERSDRYGWNDMGNGFLFGDWYKDVARFCPERKKWYVYNGKVWQADTENLKVMELAKKLADALMNYALSLPDEKQRQDYMKFVSSWQRRSYRETVLKDAASVYPVEITAFDADPFLFNCQNGTLDLRTGEFHSHKPDDMLSKLSGVKYDPDARSERWERFIDEVMQGDRDKAVFLQKSLGYALTGDTRHECLFVLYGPTSRNGKGTTMETFLRMMGDYGRTAMPDSIAQKQTANGSGPSEDIARLAGARFVNISEPDKKLVLSASLVKTLTGSDTITARYLHENSFEYRPQFKLFINTNHLPTVTDITLFSSGRVNVIRFERHFAEDERDEGLKEELARPENLSGIFNWCFEGLRLISETGFDAPAAVREATDEYRMKSDKVARFLDEEMEPEQLAETRTTEVYDRYRKWCGDNGYYPENDSNFKSALSNIATVVRRRPSGSGRTANPQSTLRGWRFRSDFEAQKWA